MVYPLGRSLFLGSLLLAIWLAGLVATLLWWNAVPETNWRLLLAECSVVVAGFAARMSWASLPEGQLAWDGEAWLWESAGYQSGVGQYKLAVIADLQQRLLLRLENQAGASLWLWVEQGAMPERWCDLRRAIYSPRRASTAGPAHDLMPGETSRMQAAAVAPSTAMPSQPVPQAKA